MFLSHIDVSLHSDIPSLQKVLLDCATLEAANRTCKKIGAIQKLETGL